MVVAMNMGGGVVSDDCQGLWGEELDRGALSLGLSRPWYEEGGDTRGILGLEGCIVAFWDCKHSRIGGMYQEIFQCKY